MGAAMGSSGMAGTVTGASPGIETIECASVPGPAGTCTMLSCPPVGAGLTVATALSGWGVQTGVGASTTAWCDLAGPVIGPDGLGPNAHTAWRLPAVQLVGPMAWKITDSPVEDTVLGARYSEASSPHESSSATS